MAPFPLLLLLSGVPVWFKVGYTVAGFLLFLLANLLGVRRARQAELQNLHKAETRTADAEERWRFLDITEWPSPTDAWAREPRIVELFRKSQQRVSVLAREHPHAATVCYAALVVVPAIPVLYWWDAKPGIRIGVLTLHYLALFLTWWSSSAMRDEDPWGPRVTGEGFPAAADEPRPERSPESCEFP